MSLLATQTISSGQNISARIQWGDAGGYTVPSTTNLIRLDLALIGMTGTAATLTMDVTLTRGATTYEVTGVSEPKFAAATANKILQFGPFAVKDGDVVKAYVTDGLTGSGVTGTLSVFAEDIVASVAGDVAGDVAGSVAGNVTGSVGSVAGNVDGNLGGNVNGDVNGNVSGDVVGNVNGKVLGGGAGAITATGVWALDSAGAAVATAANQTTILARLGSWTGTGINTILGALRAIAAKAASLTPTDLSTSTTFDNTTDSLEAIRDTIGAGTVTTSPTTLTTSATALVITRGDDYHASDSQNISVTVASYAGPSVVGATCTFSAGKQNEPRNNIFSVAATAAMSGSDLVLTANVPSSKTHNVTPGTYRADFQLTLATSGRIHTPWIGYLTVYADVTP